MMTDTKTEAPPIAVTVPLEIPARRIADLFVNAFENNHMTLAWCGGVRFRHAIFDGERVSEGFRGFVDDEGRPTPWYDDLRVWSSPAFAIDIYEIEDEGEHYDLDESEANLKRHRVTRVELEGGLKLMAEKHARHFGDFMSENDDAVTADVFLQLVTLKDVIYG